MGGGRSAFGRGDGLTEKSAIVELYRLRPNLMHFFSLRTLGFKGLFLFKFLLIMECWSLRPRLIKKILKETGL